MRITAIAHRGVVGIQGTAPLADAAVLMLSEDVGALVVYEGREFVGILTERDVVRAFAEAGDRSNPAVVDYMTPDPAVVTPSDDSAEVAVRMVKLGVRHLPIVEHGEPVGMVSARDLLSLESWPRVAV